MQTAEAPGEEVLFLAEVAAAIDPHIAAASITAAAAEVTSPKAAVDAGDTVRHIRALVVRTRLSTMPAVFLPTCLQMPVMTSSMEAGAAAATLVAVAIVAALWPRTGAVLPAVRTVSEGGLLQVTAAATVVLPQASAAGPATGDRLRNSNSATAPSAPAATRAVRRSHETHRQVRS